MGLVGESARWIVWERSRKKKKWLERHNEGNDIEKYTELQVGERRNVNRIIMLIFSCILFIIRDKVKEIERRDFNTTGTLIIVPEYCLEEIKLKNCDIKWKH